MKFPILLATASFAIVCFSAFSQTATKVDTENKTLSESLKEQKEQFNTTAPEHKKLAYEDGIKAVEESGVIEAALNVGDKAPDFTLANAEGINVNLYDELKKGPVVLTWYRGGWCPYCNINMQFIQSNLEEFTSRGANLVALTPGLPDQTLSMAEKHDLEFQVLSDLNNKVAHTYGLVFQLTPEVEAIYEEAFHLSVRNGNDSGELPLAATYVLDKDGTITWCFLHPDYRERAEIEDIIKALDDINLK